MEEVRQREANLTALQAIGPRKKIKLDTSDVSSVSVSINLIICKNYEFVRSFQSFFESFVVFSVQH